MLPSFSPFASQGLMPQSFVGAPQFGPGPSGPQGGYGMNGPLALDYQTQSPYAFGAAMNAYLIRTRNVIGILSQRHALYRRGMVK
jgi:hypothetical protein